MATRDNADNVVCNDKKKESRKERAVFLPGITQKSLDHIVTDKLYKVFNGVDKNALRDQRLLLLSYKDENDNEQQCKCYTHPKDVIGKTKCRIAKNRMRHKAVKQLIHLSRQLR